MKTRIPRIVFLTTLFFAFLFSANATIYYVKPNGTGDGSSWEKASHSIQDMIDKATSGDEVWVAKGTYYPTYEREARNPRSKSFVLKGGVSIYGGFAGYEATIEERAKSDIDSNGEIEGWEFTNETILSGDIDDYKDKWTKTENADGTWSWSITGNEDNCYTVVLIRSSDTKIDGFSVTGGNADKTNDYHCGGGILVSSAYILESSFIKNCRIYNNFSVSHGAGIYLSPPSSGSSSSNYIDHCAVYNNSSGNNGAGMYIVPNLRNRPSISYCKVYNNFSVNNGAGIYIHSVHDTSCYVTNCEVYNNSASSGGGIGYYTNTSYSSISIKDCIVYNNLASKHGGGIYNIGYYNGSSSIANCKVLDNSAKNNGGGIYTHARIDLTNCEVNNNSAENGGGIYSDVSVSTSSFKINNCKVSNNTAGNDGGGIHIISKSKYTYSISNCKVSNNTAGNDGGGIFDELDLYSNTRSSIVNCTVYNNSAINNGGGVCANYRSDVTTSLLFNNSAGSGGGIYHGSSILNCVVFNNSAEIEGGGICSSVSTINSTIINNKISNYYDTDTSQYNSVIINDLESFVNPTTFVGKANSEEQFQQLLNANWRLKENSSFINAGTVNASSPETDFDGNLRDIYGKIDMGAYEYMPPKNTIPYSEDFDTALDFGESLCFWNYHNLNWKIENKKAVFSSANNPDLVNYTEPLISYRFDATELTNVVLTYDLNYVDKANGNNTQEQLSVQLSMDDGNGWTTIQTFNNENGNIDNERQFCDISNHVKGKVFYIRFRAFGENSNNIEKWEIDNINIDVYHSLDIESGNNGKVLVDGEQDITHKKIKDSETASFEITPDVGYEVDKVLFNGEDVTSQLVNYIFISMPVTQNSVLNVTFKKLKYDMIVLYDNTEGSILANGNSNIEKVEHGGVVTFEIISNTGYEIDKVLFNSQEVTLQLSNNEFITAPIYQNSIFEVNFKKLEYNVSIQCKEEQGSITANGENNLKTVEYGDIITFEILPVEGYEIYLVWFNSQDVTSQVIDSKYITAAITQNCRFEVAFKKLKYDVSIVYDNTIARILANDRNSLNTIEHGDVITFDLQPNTGYEVDKVLFNEEDITSELINNRYTTSPITQNCTFEATFKKMRYSISMQYDDAQGIVLANGSQNLEIVEYQDVITFEITPNEGYVISKVIFNSQNVTSQLNNNKYITSPIYRNSILKVTFNENKVDVQNTIYNSFQYYIDNGILYVNNLVAGTFISVYNTNANLVGQVSSSGKEEQIRLPSQGIYILNLQKDSSSISRKIAW